MLSNFFQIVQTNQYPVAIGFSLAALIGLIVFLFTRWMDRVDDTDPYKSPETLKLMAEKDELLDKTLGLKKMVFRVPEEDYSALMNIATSRGLVLDALGREAIAAFLRTQTHLLDGTDPIKPPEGVPVLAWVPNMGNYNLLINCPIKDTDKVRWMNLSGEIFWEEVSFWRHIELTPTLPMGSPLPSTPQNAGGSSNSGIINTYKNMKLFAEDNGFTAVSDNVAKALNEPVVLKEMPAIAHSWEKTDPPETITLTSTAPKVFEASDFFASDKKGFIPMSDHLDYPNAYIYFSGKFHVVLLTDDSQFGEKQRKGSNSWFYVGTPKSFFREAEKHQPGNPIHLLMKLSDFLYLENRKERKKLRHTPQVGDKVIFDGGQNTADMYLGLLKLELGAEYTISNYEPNVGKGAIEIKEMEGILFPSSMFNFIEPQAIERTMEDLFSPGKYGVMIVSDSFTTAIDAFVYYSPRFGVYLTTDDDKFLERSSGSPYWEVAYTKETGWATPHPMILHYLQTAEEVLYLENRPKRRTEPSEVIDGTKLVFDGDGGGDAPIEMIKAMGALKLGQVYTVEKLLYDHQTLDTAITLAEVPGHQFSRWVLSSISKETD